MRRAAVLLLVAACTHASPPAATPTVVLTYDISEHGTSRLQEISLDRPYRARVRAFPGGTIATERGVYTITDKGPQLVQDLYPGRPGADSYLDVALPVAEQQGLVRRDGSGTVLGSACTWWLSKLPLESVPLALPSGGESTRSCVAADGLVLSSEETIAGAVAVRRTLVQRAGTAALTDDVLFGGPPPEGGAGTLRVKVLDVAPSPPLAVTARAPGAGWALASGAVYASLGAQGQAVSNGDRTVYVRDGRLAVLAEDQRLDGPTAPPTTGEELPSGARLTAGYDGLTLRMLTTRGILVTLSGHLTRAEILAWAATLGAA